MLEYKCTGRVEGAELIHANLEALADARFPGISVQLCDMESVTEFEIEPPQVREIVEIDFRAAGLAPQMSKVGIACRQDLIFGFARLYELTLDGRVPTWEVQVFRTRAEALGWLQEPADADIQAS